MDNLAQFSKEELVAIITQQAEMILFLQQQVAALQKEIETLKGGGKGTPLSKPPPPDWVKPNAEAAEIAEAKERKKRAKPFTRPRQTPTEEVIHACSHCPDCGRGLSGGSEYSRRQIIELPPITVRVIDHLLHARYCGVCQKRCVPAPDLSEIAVGQSRFGQQVHALVAYLRQAGRLPVRTIAAVLSALCHLKISAGEVSEMLARVAQQGKMGYGAIQKQLRQSDYVHGDETGWRENGQSGYLWSFSTPTLCYFTYPKTRAGHVVTDVLGETYPGIVVSDFYAGYNTHFGLHQRCWVHLWRDVHELKQKFPLPGVLAWAEDLRKIYDRARAFASEKPKERAAARVSFQEELAALAAPFAETSLPQSTLCKRLLQFESELFTFVEHPQVPCENNAAERSVRPRVIARKISGGTRTSAGSQTMCVLSSLFATWQLRGEEGLAACRKMLQEAQKPPVAAPA
jgi:transposase